MLQVMARAYVGMLATGTTCNFYLSDLAAGMPWINGITIVGADGRIKCSTSPERGRHRYVGPAAFPDRDGNARVRGQQLHRRTL